MNPESESDPDGLRASSPQPSATAGSAADDAACARHAQQGDRAALEALVQRHQRAVARLLWRFARSRSDLDDLVQDTFLRMIRGLHTWQPDRPFLYWLLRIAANTGRDYCRRNNVRRRHFAETEPRSGDDRPAPEAVDPQADPAARAATAEVKQFLATLPPDDCALLTLHYFEGWNLPQIARQFGWTVTATKIRAWRARNRLRETLRAHHFQ